MTRSLSSLYDARFDASRQRRYPELASECGRLQTHSKPGLTSSAHGYAWFEAVRFGSPRTARRVTADGLREELVGVLVGVTLTDSSIA